MYDATGKSNLEVFEDLFEMLSKGEKVSLQDIKDIVATRSVVDTAAGDKAVTVFYSGESEKLINTFVAYADASVRVIRRTEAYDFLADERFIAILNEVVAIENPELPDDVLKNEVNRLLYESSYYESGTLIEGEGFWTVISRRFAADTKGDAYSLCANARADRIYAMDELRTWMANSSADAKMAGYTNAELQAMGSNEARFAAVKAWTVEGRIIIIQLIDM